MAITPSDFSKIWASNADTPEYTFSDTNYLKGWDFVGNLPPTRAQWNAIQKSTDEKMKYVFDNFGAPLIAPTVADMTLQNRVYVYTGSETGYTAGHWYYWDGSAWADGGVYNSVAFITDTTLSIAGQPADAKAVGDAIALKPNVDPTLTISGAAADAKVTGKTIDNFKAGFEDLNLINISTKLTGSGYASIANGRVYIGANQSMSAYLVPVDGVSTYSFTMARFIFRVGADGETALDETITQNVTSFDSTGASYLAISFNHDSYPEATYVILKGTGMGNRYILPNWCSDLPNKVDKTGVWQVKPLNIQGVEVASANLISTATQLSNSGYATIFNGQLHIQPSSPFSAYLLPVDGVSTYSFTKARFIFRVGADGVTALDETMTQNVTSFDSTGASYLAISLNHDSYPEENYVMQRGFGKEGTVTLPTWLMSAVATAQKMGYMRASGDMSNGDILSISENNVKNNVVVTFTGNITSFDKIYVGQRTINGSGMESCYLEINSTDLIVHTDQGNATVPHGLTIANDIQVLIETETDVATSHIRIGSSGHYFDDTTNYRWLCDKGYACAVSVNSILTGCVLSWTSRNINKPIWIFGDSYVSFYDSRWIYWLIKDGFDKSCLINGYAGEASYSAMKSLVNLLTCCTPRYIVWCMGMNNADSSSAVNESWKTHYDSLITLCESKNITPILATIPNTPTINNRFKNEIVRNSGYRYIDFDLAVEPGGDGNWISGALSADNVHPTVSGAKILYMRALADLPELTSL